MSAVLLFAGALLVVIGVALFDVRAAVIAAGVLLGAAGGDLTRTAPDT